MERKIGHLGMTLLFSEKSDILMMATHRFRLELTASDHFMQATTLQTISVVADKDMAETLAQPVANLIKKGYSYIAKKACLCGHRIISKHPPSTEIFAKAVEAVLSDKNHGLLLSAIKLSERIVELEPERIEQFEKFVPHLVTRFKSLMINHSDEFLVNEVSDPFLQIALLKFFRILLRNKSQIDPSLQTLLQELPSETKIKKNTGNAVLYECAITILALEVGAPVKAAGMEIISRMLTYQDINST